MITENLSTLKIHKLTQEQYDRELAAGNIDETALYLTPDSGIHIASKTGESPVLNDSAAGGLKIDRIYGWSKQETTSGKQLLEYPYFETTKTSLGITFTDNGDGSIAISGTATDESYFNCFWNSDTKAMPIKAGEYCISVDSISNAFVGIGLRKTNGTEETVGYLTTTWLKQTFTLDEDAFLFMYIGVNNGKTVNETIKVMLNAGTEALPWEPYTGNIPSPNPEYPQPIVSAGQKLANGVQLFDKDAVTPELLDISNGAALNNSDWRLSDYIACKSLTNYYISESIAQYWQFAACFYNTNKEFISGGYLADNNIATPANTAYMRVAYSVAVNGVSIDRGNIMLNKGSTALPYEPYTGGVKKAYDVGIQKKLTGKNLLENTAKSQTVNGVTFTVNDDGTVVVNGTSTGNSVIYLNDRILENLEVGKSYIASGITGCIVEYSNGTVLYSDAFTVADDMVSIKPYIQNNNGATVTNRIFKPMIRHADIEDDTWEPYTEQTLTLNRVLRGIPLGTDIPEMFKSNALHMDGIYWDEKTQQYYIADTIDAERGVLVQRIKCLTINSIGNDFGSTSNGLKWEYGHSILDSPFDGTNVIHYINVMNERFTMVSQQYENNEETGTCGSLFGHATYTEFRFRLLKSEYPTEDDAKNAILGTTVYYPLATPIETPLTDEEIIALHQLKTYQGVTHIFGSNDPDAPMIFKYSSSEIGGVTLENSNLHAVNEVLRRRMLTHSDVVDNLASTDTNLPLSANQGRVLKDELNDLKDEIPDVLPINKGGTGATDATTALANLGGVKASETIKTAFYDDAAENIGQLLDAKCAHARELNAPAVCIYGGWQKVDYGVFYAQVVNNVVQGIYVKGDTAYIVRCDNGTDTATYSKVALQSDIDEDIPYKIVIDDTAGTINFIDR